MRTTKTCLQYRGHFCIKKTQNKTKQTNLREPEVGLSVQTEELLNGAWESAKAE